MNIYYTQIDGDIHCFGSKDGYVSWIFDANTYKSTDKKVTIAVSGLYYGVKQHSSGLAKSRPYCFVDFGTKVFPNPADK